MTSTNPTGLLIEIKPWQEDLYKHMRRPMTVADVSRKLKNAAADLGAARAAGDVDAVRGCKFCIQLLLLELIAVDVSTAYESRKKGTLLRQWSSFWETTELLSVAVAAALDS